MRGKMFCRSKMSREDRQKWKLRMYNYWQDTLEERLAGVKAGKAKLEEQIKRDATDRLHDDIRNNGNS
tara:strand:+ start:1240 stop:1443 length:204 start_codon:yes stop_codon:yes gene_type:complete